MHRFIQTFICAAAIAVSILACSDKGTDPRDAEFIIPESDISFAEHLQPMFEYKCGFETGCHSSLDTDNGLLYVELIDRTALINHQLTSTGEKLVDLNIHVEDPQSAPLYLIVLEGYPDAPTDLMPPYYLNRAPLEDQQIAGIKQWIKEGCPQ